MRQQLENNPLHRGQNLAFQEMHPRGTVTYTISEGADKDLFSITPETGRSYYAAKDFENPEDANNNNDYEIGITATDIEGNIRYKNWTVNVTDDDTVEFSVLMIYPNATTVENNEYTGART